MNPWYTCTDLCARQGWHRFLSLLRARAINSMLSIENDVR